MKAQNFLGLVLFLIAVVGTDARSQWVQTNGPFGVPVRATLSAGGSVFAATDYGVSHSTDNGSHWTSVKLPKGIKSLGSLGTTIFAGAQGGVYRSTDNGATWVFATNKGINAVDVTNLASFGGYLFAGNTYGVSRSSDSGENWTLMNSGSATDLLVIGTRLFQSVSGTYGGVFRSNDTGTTWTKTSSGLTDTDIYSLASIGTTMFAGCGNGVVSRSTDYGSSWSSLNIGLGDTVVTSLASTGTTLLAGTRGAGTFRTSDNGSTWMRISSGLTNKYVLSLLPTGQDVLVSTMAGVFRSTDNGTSWTEANTDMVFKSVSTLGRNSAGTTLFAGCAEGGISRSTDGGASWFSPNTGLLRTDGSAYSVSTIVAKGSVLLAGANGQGGAYRSIDDGVTWIPSVPGLANKIIASLFVSGNYIFAASGGHVYRSSDDGTNWTQTDAGLPAGATVASFFQVGQSLFAAPYAGGVFVSTDNGASWTAAKTGFPVTASVYTFAVDTSSGGKKFLFAGGGYGVYFSTDLGASWTAVNAGLPQHVIVNALAFAGNTLIAGTDVDSIYTSTDRGTTWVRANKGLADKAINAFVLFPNATGGTDLYAGSGSSGVFRYTGKTIVNPSLVVTKPAPATIGTPFWVEVQIGVPKAVSGLYGISFKLRSDRLTCTYVDGTGTVGTFPDPGVITFFRKTDDQTVDMAISKLSTPGLSGAGLLAKAQFVSSAGGTVRFTIDDLSAIDQNGISIPLDTTGLIVSFGGPVVRPVGVEPYQLGKPFWVQVQVGGPDSVKGLYGVSFKLKSGRSSCTYVDGSAVAGAFLGGAPVSFFRRIDDQTVDMAVSKIAAPGVNGNGVVAKAQFVSSTGSAVTFSILDLKATDQAGLAIPLGVDNFTIASITTSIEGDRDLPAEFHLSQNYPNPFNPTTNVEFGISDRAYVMLKIFDLLGREVAVLVNEERAPGRHVVQWNASGVPSGIYFYTLRAGENFETKRMVLLK